MVDCQPEGPGVVEKNQRKDDRERNPNGKLSSDRDWGEGVEKEKCGHGDADGCGVVHIDCANEVALLALELEAAVPARSMHPKGLGKQPSQATTRASEAKSFADQRQSAKSQFKA